MNTPTQGAGHTDAPQGAADDPDPPSGVRYWPHDDNGFGRAMRARLAECCPGRSLLTVTAHDARAYFAGLPTHAVTEFRDRVRTWSAPPVALLNEADRILTHESGRAPTSEPEDDRTLAEAHRVPHPDEREQGGLTAAHAELLRAAQPVEAEASLSIEELEQALASCETYADDLRDALVREGKPYEPPSHDNNPTAVWDDSHVVAVLHAHALRFPLSQMSLREEEVLALAYAYLDAYGELRRRVAIRQEEV